MVLLPKTDKDDVIVTDSAFWSDMELLCDNLNEGTRERLSFVPLTISLWDSYACGKRNGSCYNPWVCTRNDSYIDGDFESELAPFISNTKIKNPKLRQESSQILSAEAFALVWYYYPE